MRSVVSGLLTNYQTEGEGKDLLLVHGWGDSLETFSALAAKLSKQYRVTRLDLPGFGQTEAPKEVWGLDEYAEFLEEFIKKSGIKPFGLIGHSNGGALIIRGAGKGILRPDKIVLLASAGIRSGKAARRLAAKLTAKAGKAAVFWMPERQKTKLKLKYYGVVGSDMHVAPHLHETFKKSVRQDVQKQAAAIALPVLLVYGAADKATPPEFGATYKMLIKNSKLQVLDGAGHFVHHDKPDETYELIRIFLDD